MNRRGRQERVGSILQLFGNPVGTYSTWLSPKISAEPAYHTYSSVLWQVVRGTGWVVYEQKYTKSWSIAYLWPGISWGAMVDQPYFFLPESRMHMEKTCFVEQALLGEEMIFEGYFPVDVNVLYCGEISAIGKTWIDLTNEHTTSRIPLSAQKRETIGGISVGAMKQIFDEVELDVFLAEIRRRKKFDPRIIYPNREITGSREWEGCDGWMVETVADSKVCKPL